mmetsp:Transcript_33270/g.108800  ORF Transcript_33270/g.108800 Transcript_33270/m.108800 type:complete len:88 (-) Transcript_33270:35-298(-)
MTAGGGRRGGCGTRRLQRAAPAREARGETGECGEWSAAAAGWPAERRRRASEEPRVGEREGACVGCVCGAVVALSFESIAYLGCTPC